METITIRDQGDNEGPSVVDKLLTTAQARQERGRVEIDSSCSNRVMREISSLSGDFILPGTFVTINDVEKGAVSGIVLGMSISIGSDSTISRVLRVETEAV